MYKQQQKFNKYAKKNTRRDTPPKPTPKPIPEDCICQRSYALVICMMCSYRFNGRVRKPCPAHPQTIFLMDMERCPQCYVLSNVGLLEYPTPS